MKLETKRAKPNLTDDELKLMYPDIFEQEAKVVGELVYLVLNWQRQSIMFQQRLGTAVQNLIQPELDFIDKQNSLIEQQDNYYNLQRIECVTTRSAIMAKIILNK